MQTFFGPCLLLIFAALATGFVAGDAADLPSHRRRFWIGYGVSILLTLMFLVLAVLNLPAIRQFLVDKAGNLLPSPMGPAQIPALLLWCCAAGGAVLLFFLFLLAFNCRIRAGNRYAACGWILLFGAAFYFTSVWGYYGLSVFVQMLRDQSRNYAEVETGIALFLLTAILLVSWTCFTLKNGKKGWKRLLAHAGIMIGVFAGCWLLGLGSAWIYGSSALSEARRLNIAPWRIISEFSPEQQAEWEKVDRFYREHEDFELPINGNGFWRKRPELKERELIPEHKRAVTLKLFDTPEFEAYVASHEILKNSPPGGVSLPALNHARAYIRIRAGKAALYAETGQPEKILPEFRKAAEVALTPPDGRSTQIVELVQNAIRLIWSSTLLSIGPDGPEYAPFYREMLKKLTACEIRAPDDAGFFVGLLEDEFHFQDEYFAILSAPGKIAVAASGLREALALRKIAPELEKQQIFQTAPGCDPFPDDKPPLKHAKTIVLLSRETLALGITGLALKCYRSEKGRYPEKLEQLVPEYLETLPFCPSNGKPLLYETDGTDFTLTLSDPNRKRQFSTEKNY